MTDSSSVTDTSSKALARVREKLASSPLVTRLSWGFAFCFIVLHVITGVYHAHHSLVEQASQLVLSIAERARVIDELTVTRGDRVEALAKISDANFSIALAENPTMLPAGERRWHRETLVREKAAVGLAELGFVVNEVHFAFVFRHREPQLLLSLRARVDPAVSLASANAKDSASALRWLIVRASAEPARWQRHAAGMLWTSLLALLILGLLLWATRRFTRFLPAFVTAAERVGSLGAADYLPEEGPRELRRLSVAFNTMQDKIAAHEQERRTMLGAVSHDLRTLVTRLSLRLEHVEGLPSREKLQDDLASMTRIVDEALAFSRDESCEEPLVKLEFLSLVQTVIDSRNEEVALHCGAEPEMLSGGDVVAGVVGEGLPAYIRGQPVALKRALLNLIDNAVLYGGHVSVRLWLEEQMVVIVISDSGLGIAADDQKRVLKPYVRLEESRNRATGGAGLGLAIANNVIRRHRGRLSFVWEPQDRDNQAEAVMRFGVRIDLPLFD